MRGLWFVLPPSPFQAPTCSALEGVCVLRRKAVLPQGALAKGGSRGAAARAAAVGGAVGGQRRPQELISAVVLGGSSRAATAAAEHSRRHLGSLERGAGVGGAGAGKVRASGGGCVCRVEAQGSVGSDEESGDQPWSLQLVWRRMPLLASCRLVPARSTGCL